MLTPLALGLILQTPEVDPNRLSMGRPGELTLSAGQWLDCRTGAKASAAAFAAAADSYSFVFVGEQHDNATHHQNQAAVISELVKRGRTVVVGFEMFTRPNQINLNPWSLGYWSQEQFVTNADWKGQWGFPFEIYKPIFDTVRENRLPMVALNVPRDWVRAVGRGGLAALTPDQQSQIPKVGLDNKQHKEVFTALMGGHPMTGPSGDNVYAAQSLWDEGMADSAIKYLDKRYGHVLATPTNVVFVIVAGVGHGMYHQGINYRIKKRTGMDCLTLIQTEADPKSTVSRGLGDFVFASSPVARE